MNTKQMADTIRMIALHCESADVLSCEFGNEFAKKVEEFLDVVLATKTEGG